ncbi:MAG: hypothetical protein SV375_05190 [Thermodesulfobacteriota bacterium]|nr:hypothetical protein [Thermodesulfobacteriota bacterium]
MKITDAKLCLNCDEVFEGPRCPVCGGEACSWLGVWLSPPEARDDYFAIIDPGIKQYA